MNFYETRKSQSKKHGFCLFQAFFKIFILTSVLTSTQTLNLTTQEHGGADELVNGQVGHVLSTVWYRGHGGLELVLLGQHPFLITKKLSPNFQARYTYGNKTSQRGIINMHVNILDNTSMQCNNFTKVLYFWCLVCCVIYLRHNCL